MWSPECDLNKRLLSLGHKVYGNLQLESPILTSKSNCQKSHVTLKETSLSAGWRLLERRMALKIFYPSDRKCAFQSSRSEFRRLVHTFRYSYELHNELWDVKMLRRCSLLRIQRKRRLHYKVCISNTNFFRPFRIKIIIKIPKLKKNWERTILVKRAVEAIFQQEAVFRVPLRVATKFVWILQEWSEIIYFEVELLKCSFCQIWTSKQASLC